MSPARRSPVWTRASSTRRSRSAIPARTPRGCSAAVSSRVNSASVNQSASGWGLGGNSRSTNGSGTPLRRLTQRRKRRKPRSDGSTSQVPARLGAGRRRGLGLALGCRGFQAARRRPESRIQPRGAAPRGRAPETKRAVRARMGARPRVPVCDRGGSGHPPADRRGVRALPAATLQRRELVGRCSIGSEGRASAAAFTKEDRECLGRRPAPRLGQARCVGRRRGSVGSRPLQRSLADG
jgi:hypothetical protein